MRRAIDAVHKNVVERDPPDTHVEWEVFRTVHRLRECYPIYDVVVDREVRSYGLNIVVDANLIEGTQRWGTKEVSTECVARKGGAVEDQHPMAPVSQETGQN